jgi:hypothetical protein
VASVLRCLGGVVFLFGHPTPFSPVLNLGVPLWFRIFGTPFVGQRFGVSKRMGGSGSDAGRTHATGPPGWDSTRRPGGRFRRGQCLTSKQAAQLLKKLAR